MLISKCYKNNIAQVLYFYIYLNMFHKHLRYKLFSRTTQSIEKSIYNILVTLPLSAAVVFASTNPVKVSAAILEICRNKQTETNILK